MPDQDDLDRLSVLQIFGNLLKDRDLWVMNRWSVSHGFGIGVFCAFLPMPFETVVACFLAITFRANLPIAIATVWISNPLTWVPLYTPCYLLGAKLLALDPIPLQQINLFSLGWHYVALWLGCLITGSIVAIISRYLVSTLWRIKVRSAWQQRRRRRMARKAGRVAPGSSES